MKTRKDGTLVTRKLNQGRTRMFCNNTIGQTWQSNSKIVDNKQILYNVNMLNAVQRFDKSIISKCETDPRKHFQSLFADDSFEKLICRKQEMQKVQKVHELHKVPPWHDDTYNCRSLVTRSDLTHFYCLRPFMPGNYDLIVAVLNVMTWFCHFPSCHLTSISCAIRYVGIIPFF